MTKYIVVSSEIDKFGTQKENILIAHDECGEAQGVVCIYPFFAYDTEPEHPHNLYLHFRAEGTEDLSELVKDVLLEKALERASEIKSEAGQTRTRVYTCFFEYQKDEIAYFIERGFMHDEGMYILERQNDVELPHVELPECITIQSWKMRTDMEQKRFIETHRKIFPRHPYTAKRLQEIKSLPGWNNFTALSETKIAGNIMMYIEDENTGIGYIEDLFVQRQWRQQGVAKYLLVKALRYFQEIGIARIRLEVWSANEVALHLYRNFGFDLVRETEIAVGRYV
jgi:GNAT superfamily N-acetyltransferase